MNFHSSAVLIVSLTLAVPTPARAQHLSKADAAYHEYRMADINPPFGLAKVRRLVKRIKTVHLDDESNRQALSEKVFDSLTIPERFTYCLIHPEDFDQDCAEMPEFVGERKKIYAELLAEDGTWSDRQNAFFEHHEDEVVKLLRTTIRTQHRVGLNVKQAILEVEGIELIPDLVREYKRSNRDRDILTVLLRLMQDEKYKPFLSSAIYKKLYGNEDTSYQSFISYTPENAKFVIDTATAMASGRKP